VVKDACSSPIPRWRPLVRGLRGAKRSSEAALAQAPSWPADATGHGQASKHVGDDPLPNGLSRNRKALEAIVRFAHEQKILAAHGQAGGDVRGQYTGRGVARPASEGGQV